MIDIDIAYRYWLIFNIDISHFLALAIQIVTRLRHNPVFQPLGLWSCHRYHTCPWSHSHRALGNLSAVSWQKTSFENQLWMFSCTMLYIWAVEVFVRLSFHPISASLCQRAIFHQRNMEILGLSWAALPIPRPSTRLCAFLSWRLHWHQPTWVLTCWLCFNCYEWATSFFGGAGFRIASDSCKSFEIFK